MKNSLIQTGQYIPSFNIVDLNGKQYTKKSIHGKTVIFIFFTTWCGACLDELKYFENKVWKHIDKSKLILLSIGRKHNKKELIEYRKKHGLTLPMAVDIKGKTYYRFAKKMVPRIYLIDKNGKITYQTSGFDESECDYIINKIHTQL